MSSITKKKIPQNVVWSPQPKQALFMSRPEFEGLYGGAAGGGKSDALLMEGLRQVEDRNYRAIIFRKTFPQLTELMDRSIDLYKKAFPRARFNESKHVWKFSTGAKIYFASMQHPKDRFNYQGKQFQYIAFDELTHFSLEEYLYLLSRCRPRGPNQRCYVRSSANPGGIGHGHVKARFITPMPPLTRKYELLEVEGQYMLRDRIFVPATIFDNKILLQNDPNYLATLSLLPEAEMKALLYGDWDSFQGQVFSEWKNDRNHYEDHKWTHVIKPFQIPSDWRRYRTFDFGYARPFSVGWWAIDYDGRAYRYRELYGCTNQPDQGVKWEPSKIAQKIKEIEDKYEKGNKIIGIADPSIWDKSRGESIAEMMERYGVYFSPGDNTRIAGKMQIHYRLAFDDEGYPMMYVFETCKHFIRTIPNLVYDELDVEDVDTKQEDHIYDETRYFCMDNLIPPRRNVAAKPISYDPLSTDESKFDRYGFMRL